MESVSTSFLRLMDPALRSQPTADRKASQPTMSLSCKWRSPCLVKCNSLIMLTLQERGLRIFQGRWERCTRVLVWGQKWNYDGSAGKRCKELHKCLKRQYLPKPARDSRQLREQRESWDQLWHWGQLLGSKVWWRLLEQSCVSWPIFQ